MRHYKIELDNLNITKSQIEKAMGFESGNSPDPFPDLIDEVLDIANTYCSIEGGYVLRDDINFDLNNHKLLVGIIDFYAKKIVINQIKKSEKIALFLCTAGPEIGEWSKKLMSEGETFKGYIIDVAGSEIVESAMDRIQNTLEEEMNDRGLNITNRYSPGYCGWNVSEQQKLFTFFPDDFCGVKLSDTSLMYPIKSVSGIIGIGKEVKRKNYPCKLCDDKNCIYRGRRFTG
ncbi:MAG: hypothetical protein JSV22_14300 [Bacteroidales bacterium]|nr:MAG: hypothetical protein JSV22_14300 [Bacteroidales bacterium]